MPQLLQSRREQLTAEARQRCDRLLGVLSEAMSWRGRRGLRQIIERAWLSLGGLAASDDQQRALREATAFFDLLQQSERGGELAEPQEFQRKLRELYAPAETPAPGMVEVMTIHAAKGLEWDTVIVPGLARPPRREQEQLLYWREFVSAGERHLLLAPIDPAETKDDVDSVKKYLSRLASDRDAEELKRLLYVACTRARSGLHLVTELPQEGKPPHRDSMLSLLWDLDGIRSEIKPFSGLSDDTDDVASDGADSHTASGAQPAIAPGVFRRLPLEWKLPSPPPPLQWHAKASADTAKAQPHTFDWASQKLRHVGTVTHRVLQQIGR